MSLTVQISLGLIAGAIFGIFFGDLSTKIHFIGQAYVNLLQMSVLPYMVVSLVHGIGSLTPKQAKKFVATGGISLIIFWLIGIAMVFAATRAFPDIESASFFSAAVESEVREQRDAVDMYIPANPFRSMSDNVIPAVVVFSIFLGTALIGVQGKESLLHGLRLLLDALMRVAGFAVKAAPIGVFALTASAAGTISIAEFSRLQVYLITVVLACGISAFAILPGLVSALTPFRYREVLAASWGALVLAFTTANAFVVLPLIVEKIKGMFAERCNDINHPGDSIVEVVTPLAYNFSLPGKLLPLLFVFFTAWFYDKPIDFIGTSKAFLLGLLSLAGSPRGALPYLLDQMKLPSDIFQLYLVSEILVDRMHTLLTCMSLFAFTILTTALMTKLARLDVKKLLIFLGASFLLTVGIFLLARQGLFYLTKDSYRGKEIVTSMRLHEKVPAKVIWSRAEAEAQARSKGHDAGGSVLNSILQRKVLRVGFRPDVIPFSYVNQYGELVGLDIAHAHKLARDLGCSVEFIRTDREHMAADLRNRLVDIVMSKVVVTPEGFTNVRFSDSYLTLHAAFVTDDSRRGEFAKPDVIRRLKGVRIAISRDNVYRDTLRSLFPDASLVVLDDKARFFQVNLADALFVTAEEGSTWTLINPFYTVVITQPPLFYEFLSYPVAMGDTDFVEYINQWIKAQRQSGDQQKEYDYWVLGKQPFGKQQRWSVIRDVLHWIE